MIAPTMELEEALRILAAFEREKVYRMKRDTVRPQDKIDASVLRERFELEDE